MQISLPLVRKSCIQLVSILEARSIWPSAAVVALILVWASMTARQAVAESPLSLYSASVPVPLSAADCRLAAQILNVSIENVDEHAWATVEGRFIVENTNRLDAQTITMTIPSSLPGGLVFDPEHLTDFAVRASGDERELTALHLTPSPESNHVVTQAYALAIDLDAGSAVEIGLSYKQNLGDGDQITFRFANSLGSRWPGTVGSSLVAFELPESLSHREQILSVQPENMVFDGRKMTWYDSDFEPKDDIELSFVNPSLWKQIEQSRLTAMERHDSPEAHYQLASLYKQLLSTWPATGESSEFDLLMLAELEIARQLAGEKPDPVRCAIQAELANFYTERLTDSTGQLSASFASQALYELEEASQVCPENELSPESLSKLGDLYLHLARIARTSGFYEEALSYLNQLDDLRKQRREITAGLQTDLSLERRLCYLAWVEQMLAGGDVERALLLAKEGEVIDVLAVDGSLAPRFSSIQATISTYSAERKIDIAFDFSSLLSDSTPVVKELEQARQTWVGIGSNLTVGSNALELSLTIPFVNAEDLFQKQSGAARALPDWAELSFVRDVLSPRGIEMVLSESWWETCESYREVVDVYPTEAKLADRQKACEAELAQYPLNGSVESPEGNEVILTSKIKHHLTQRCRDDWKRLLQDSRAIFSVDWNPKIGGPTQRAWLVLAGQVQEMKLESWSYSPLSIVMRIGSYLLRALIVLVILFIAVRLILR